MGLFRKDTPVEKKLKQLTGGFLLSTSFNNKLKENNLRSFDGTKIKNQLKDEIKKGKVNEDNLESRLNQLIKEFSNKSSSRFAKKKKCPNCGETQEFSNSVCTECGYDFVNKTKKHIEFKTQEINSEKEIECPICHKKQNSSNEDCIECGYDFVNKKIKVKKKKCPSCNGVLSEKTDVCPYCKYDFINKMEVKKKKCPSCNGVLSEKTDVCPYCNYDFKSKTNLKYIKKCPNCLKIQNGMNKECVYCKKDLTQVDYEYSDDLIDCPSCNHKIPKNSNFCPFCKYKIINKHLEFKYKVQFLSNYDFNLKICPNCNTKFLKVDPFCFNCGTSFITSKTLKNDNLEVKNGKLVGKSETKYDDELSDLELLYNQTVQSKYDLSFKVIYVLYLEEFRKNPLKKFSDKLAKNYGTTPNKLKKQAIEDEYIENASPLLEASNFKVTDLKEILKKHNLKVSGKKDELIERLGENLTEDELKKYFKSKNYQISVKGEEFLVKNNYIIYIYSDDDISNALYPSEIAKIFEEKEYSQNEIYTNLLRYLKRILDEKLTRELWVDFKKYSNAIAQIQEDNGDLKDALNTRFKVFLFDINNYSITLNKPNPRKTRLKQKDISKIVKLLHNLTLSIDELKVLFETAYDEVLFETDINSQNSLIYLLKVFGGEDLTSISKEINETYSNPH